VKRDGTVFTAADVGNVWVIRALSDAGGRNGERGILSSPPLWGPFVWSTKSCGVRYGSTRAYAAVSGPRP
jgi:hypothetical protein